MLTPAQRSLRARCAAYALHAQGGTSTRAGTAAFLARFEHQVDPDHVLPPDERARRAEYALKAHMTSLALRASRAKTRKNPAVIEPSAGFVAEVRGGAASAA